MTRDKLLEMIIAARDALTEREPLTNEQMGRAWIDRAEFADPPIAFVKGVRWAEKMHGIGGKIGPA